MQTSWNLGAFALILLAIFAHYLDAYFAIVEQPLVIALLSGGTALLKSNSNSNGTAVVLMALAVLTRYLDHRLGIPGASSISLGLLASGTTLLELSKVKEYDRP